MYACWYKFWLTLWFLNCWSFMEAMPKEWINIIHFSSELSLKYILQTCLIWAISTILFTFEKCWNMHKVPDILDRSIPHYRILMKIFGCAKIRYNQTYITKLLGIIVNPLFKLLGRSEPINSICTSDLYLRYTKFEKKTDDLFSKLWET